jgi:hypothetical protein
LLAWAAAATGLTLAPHVDADEDGYGLDELSRRIPARGPVQCPDVDLSTYRGEHLRYAQAARIYVGFEPRLKLFEKLANEVAIEIYGRKPRRLQHLGTFNCRRISAYPGWVSEHGLGNAIDVEGFDFGALPKDVESPDGLPKQLRHPFAVRVQSHWKVKHPLLASHARFLRTLAKRAIADTSIFRVLLGPGYPGHHNHFHFDCAPYRLVDGFEDIDS